MSHARADIGIATDTYADRNACSDHHPRSVPESNNRTNSRTNHCRVL